MCQLRFHTRSNWVKRETTLWQTSNCLLGKKNPLIGWLGLLDWVHCGTEVLAAIGIPSGVIPKKSRKSVDHFFFIPTGINSTMFKRLCGAEKIRELELVIFHPREWYNNNKIKKKRMVVISLVQKMETKSQIVLCLFNLMSTGDSYNMIQFNPYGPWSSLFSSKPYINYVEYAI